jgi:glutamate formiminotransferase/formiminotetrahydrofolate cyclodeaminase
MDDHLTQLPAHVLLERLASAAPTPGGGTASALVGGIGAALVEMVVALTRGRPDAAGDDSTLAEIGTAAAALRAELLDLAERDANAYAAVVQARRLPRSTEAELAVRRDAVAAAIRDATRVPIETARAALAVLDHAEQLAPIGNPNAISDVGVAGLMAAASVRGALLNVRINRPSLAPTDALQAEADAIEAEHASLDDRERRLAHLVAGRMA